MSEIQLMGGQINQKHLNKKLFEEDLKVFEIGKMIWWGKLINDNMYPKKWLKPNNKGTKVNFDMIKDETMLIKALEEYIEYAQYINKTYLECEMKIPTVDELLGGN